MLVGLYKITCDSPCSFIGSMLFNDHFIKIVYGIIFKEIATWTITIKQKCTKIAAAGNYRRLCGAELF